MKTASALAMALLFCVAPLSADDQPMQTPERHRGEGRVYDQKNAMSIVPPKGWKPFKGDKGFYLTFDGPRDNYGNMSMRVAKEIPVTIDELKTSMKKGLSANNKEWKLIDEGVVEIDGTKAYFIMHRFVYQEGDKSIEVQHAQFYLPRHKGKSYAMTFTTAPARFDKYRQSFEESAKSFRAD